MQLRHCVVTEWICCLICQRWTLPRHVCPVVDISHGLFPSRLKTHLFSKSFPAKKIQSFILKKVCFGRFWCTKCASHASFRPILYRLIWCISVYARDFYQLFSSLRSTGMVFLSTEVPVWFIARPGKYRYGILSHTVPLQALVPVRCRTHKPRCQWNLQLCWTL